MTTTTVNAVDLVLEDHRTIDSLFTTYESTPPAAAAQRLELVHAMIRELSVHAGIEEQFLYPLIRTSLPNGGFLAEHAIEEHQEVKDLLSVVDKMKPQDDGFDLRVREIITDVREHVAEEERELLPALRAAVDEQRLLEVGGAMAAAKHLAPTRPHPKSPNRPPGNFVVAPMARMADQVADALRDARKS